MSPAADARRLAVIPARGGSKGLPGKNLAVLAGETLLARAVRCARETGLFQTVLVSTDDEAIAAEAKRSGAEVPFLRPDALAGDRAAVIDAVRDVIERLGGQGFTLVALLEPTSPLRTPEIVAAAIAGAERDGFDAALTVSPAPLRYHPMKQLSVAQDGRVGFAHPDGSRIVNRQELTPTYVRNGMCYAARASALRAGSTMLGTSAQAIIVPGPVVNIDDAEDLELARRLIETAA